MQCRRYFIPVMHYNNITYTEHFHLKRAEKEKQICFQTSHTEHTDTVNPSRNRKHKLELFPPSEVFGGVWNSDALNWNKDILLSISQHGYRWKLTGELAVFNLQLEKEILSPLLVKRLPEDVCY